MGNIAEFVCEHLPEDWLINIVLEHGCASIELFNPDGDMVNEFSEGNDGDTLESMVVERVNYARTKDGLDDVIEMP